LPLETAPEGMKKGYLPQRTNVRSFGELLFALGRFLRDVSGGDAAKF